MSPRLTLSYLLAFLAGSWTTLAFADGGTIRAVKQQDEFRVTVFTSPTPLRAGTVDISLFIQNDETSEAVLDAEVLMQCSLREDSLRPITAPATLAHSTNQLLYAALIELPASGEWKVQVTCELSNLDQPIEIHFFMDVAPPLPAWLSVWPWFAWPILPVLLYIIHRILVARTESHQEPDRGG